jgi:dTDP-4-amino-4,6-dideoxygalactose transaminase
MKNTYEDLAILGGPKAFTNHIHVGRPNIGNRQRLFEYFNEILDAEWLTNNGPFVQKFEKRMSSLTGAKHCIAMCNGTVALEITIRGLELTGEVLVPAFTFIATAHSLQWQEITPVFCDIDPETHTIDPSKIESMITPRTTGIIGVHLWGRPCQIEALTEIAQRHNLKLIFDAAHALGCSYKEKMIGNFGNAEVFSLHATKCIQSVEGGVVTTNDDELAKKLRLMKNFGFTGYDQVDYIGTNGKMNELCAAMKLVSLENMHKIVATNFRNYNTYKLELENINGVNLIYYGKIEKYNYQYIIVEIDEEAANISRDVLLKILHEENILARRYFYPGCHNMEPYKSYFPHAKLLVPETERLVKRVLVLPTGNSIVAEDIRKICQIIRLSTIHGKEISKYMKKTDKQGAGFDKSKRN